MKKQLEKYKHHIAIAEAFVHKFGDKIPDGIGGIGINNYTEFPSIGFSCGYSGDDRNRVLSLLGEVFGTKGWIRVLNYDRTNYNWTQRIDDVDITIVSAESVPTEEKSAVPPTAFPLLLKTQERCLRCKRAISSDYPQSDGLCEDCHHEGESERGHVISEKEEVSA